MLAANGMRISEKIINQLRILDGWELLFDAS